LFNEWSIAIGDSRPDIQGGHSMNVVYNLRGAGGATPEAGGFFNLKALKWLKIGTINT